MTKKELADQIYQSVQNHGSKKDAVEAIEALLSPLEPKDPERFANWGFKPEPSAKAENFSPTAHPGQ